MSPFIVRLVCLNILLLCSFSVQGSEECTFQGVEQEQVVVGSVKDFGQLNGLNGGLGIRLDTEQAFGLSFLWIPDQVLKLYQTKNSKNFQSILVPGQQVIVWTSPPDRYLDRQALVWFKEKTDEKRDNWIFLQKVAIENGMALLLPSDTGLFSQTCLEVLDQAEKLARDKGLGLWRENNLNIFSGRDLSGLEAMVGQDVLISGLVVSVGQRSRLTYLNFGRNWSEDLTVLLENNMVESIEKRLGVKTIEDISGKRILLRGWINLENGPKLDVKSIYQITR